jgi:hypothetical protein
MSRNMEALTSHKPCNVNALAFTFYTDIFVHPLKMTNKKGIKCINVLIKQKLLLHYVLYVLVCLLECSWIFSVACACTVIGPILYLRRILCVLSYYFVHIISVSCYLLLLSPFLLVTLVEEVAMTCSCKHPRGRTMERKLHCISTKVVSK